MAKSRELHWTPPPTAPCPTCNGSGQYVGMFSSAPCYYCQGTGFVQADGEPFPAETYIEIQSEHLRQLNYRNEKLRSTIRRLKALPCVQQWIRDEKRKREEKAMGYGTDKYQGD